MAERKTRFPAFIGSSNTTRAARFDSERTINMYLEGLPQQQGANGKDSEPQVLIGTPGLKPLITVGTGPIRAVYSVSLSNSVYVVSGAQIYKLDATLANPVLVGTMLTSTGFVSIADNGNSGSNIVFVDGAYGYTSNLTGTPVLTQITSANFYPASTVSFQDGYFVFCQTGTSYYFITDLYAVTFPALNQANKSGDSDILIAAICNNRELYLLGQNTCEVWALTGASGSTPFARQDGKFSQTGCLAAGTVTRLAGTFLWLGANPQGGAVVYMLQNEQGIRVSTHAIELSLQNAGALITSSTAYGWQIEGHYFYTLNVPGTNTTWTYDLETTQWFEQQSDINGITGRHLGSCHTFYLGSHIVGDYQSNQVYTYDFNTYTDNGNPIVRTRQAPHVASSLNRIFYHMLELDFQPGQGIVNGTVNAMNPRISLEISNDGGMTFSNPIFQPLGKVGSYLTRARFQRLGSSRDRVFRVTMSDPCRFYLLSAQLSIEVGNS
jgi:hypothetical protein